MTRKQPEAIPEGRAAAVLLGIDSSSRAESDRELLASLARGEREIAEGRGYDLDEVLAEAGLMMTVRVSASAS